MSFLRLKVDVRCAQAHGQLISGLETTQLHSPSFGSTMTIKAATQSGKQKKKKGKAAKLTELVCIVNAEHRLQIDPAAVDAAVRREWLRAVKVPSVITRTSPMTFELSPICVGADSLDEHKHIPTTMTAESRIVDQEKVAWRRFKCRCGASVRFSETELLRRLRHSLETIVGAPVQIEIDSVGYQLAQDETGNWKRLKATEYAKDDVVEMPVEVAATA
ncbi:hypothetical protein HQ563_02980 [bacterium]|nr:hypothetical protein [bacterium]